MKSDGSKAACLPPPRRLFRDGASGQARLSVRACAGQAHAGADAACPCRLSHLALLDARKLRRTAGDIGRERRARNRRRRSSMFGVEALCDLDQMAWALAPFGDWRCAGPAFQDGRVTFATAAVR